MHYPRESELMEFMAYHLWEREGRPAGRAEDHWREAERLLEIEFRLGGWTRGQLTLMGIIGTRSLDKQIAGQQAKAEEFDPKILRLVGLTPEQALGKAMGPAGCDHCNRTGYRGRKAIFEMMQMNSQIRELAFNLAPVSELRKAAVASGMRSLVEDGRIKILNGVTTPDEIARSTQVDLDNLEAPAEDEESKV